MVINATKPEIGSYEDYIDEIKDIWETGSMTNNGSKVQRFRNKLISKIGCKNAELFVNGHLALLIALKALELPNKGEVLTSPFTFVSTTNAIVQCGLTPVFCDIDRTYNIDIESIKRNITSKTCAIVVPHIFGIPCHVHEIEIIAKERGLKVVYDGAQAFGTKIDGVDIGCFGDITMFSFHAIKVFNSIEGGLLTFKDENLQSKFILYRNFGISYGETNDVEVVGYNAKMNEFQAAMGLVNLKTVDEIIRKRKELALCYIEKLRDIPGIETFPYNDSIEYNYAYFPILINAEKYGMTRDDLWKYLNNKGIGSRKLYDKLTCDYSIFCENRYCKDTEYASRISRKCLDLPIYSGMTGDEINIVCSKIRQYILMSQK